MDVREAPAGYRFDLVPVADADDVPPGYRRSEVGVIPADWTLPELRVLTKQSATYGVVKAGQFLADGIPMLRGGDIKNGRTVTGDLPLISKAKSDEYERTTLQVGDVVVALVGYPGEAAVIDRLLEGANISRAVGLIRPQRALASNFLACYLNSPQGRSEFLKPSAGSAQLVVNLRDLNELPIPLPPTKAEQEAIAEALSDADALIESLQQLIAKQRAIKQGAMQALLTGRQRLPGFSGEWQTKRLEAVLAFQVGCPFSSAYFNDEGDGIRLVRNRDLKADDQILHYSGPYGHAFVVKDDDVLVGMDGDFLACRWRKGPALLNQRVGRIVPKGGLDSTFAFYCLADPLREIEDATSSTTVKHLSHGDVEGIEMPLPEVREQTAIAAVLSDMDAAIDALEARLAKTRALKAGMMQQLLTGRIRLVPPKGNTHV